MDKIKALLEKSGVKSELSEEICKSLEQYRTTVREELEALYAERVDAAKKVCLEETEAYKQKLAHRVQIFCETKGASVEAQIAKQSALRETDAETRLKSIVRLLEGVEPNGEQHTISPAVIEQLRKQLQVVSEEKARAVEAANRSNSIAERVLKNNRKLEKELAGRPIHEGRRTQPAVRRIDKGRKTSARPATSRPTLLESQDRRPVPPPNGAVRTVGTGYGVSEIAQAME